jgi:hypothetical protein
MSRHRAARAPRARRRGARAPIGRRTLALGSVAAVTVVALGTVVTSAAFTDAAEADLGAVGGSYDIALVDASGALVQGNPTPLVLTTVAPGPGGAPTVELDAVTTTPATGPVTLSITNARGAALPPDPGVAGPGAEPYDVARFTVTVDGTAVATAVPAAQLAPLRIDGWETGVARTIQVSVALPDALGNPYYYGRAIVLGIRLDGSTS